MGSKPQISIVIPAYNEADNIVPCVEEAIQACAAQFTDYEIIVVDDGSRDRTYSLAQQLAQRHSRVKALTKPNGGIGSAVTLGFNHAQGELLTYTPADRQFDLRELSLMLPLLQGHDLVVGGKRELLGYSLKRKITSNGMRGLLWLFFGFRFRDVNFIHLYRASIYPKIRPQSPGGFFHAETIALAFFHKLKVAEVFLTLKPRPSGVATAWSLKNIRRTFLEILKLRLRLWLNPPER